MLAPTFVPFHPWMTLEGYADLLATIADLDLVEHVSPVQLSIRLLVPGGIAAAGITGGARGDRRIRRGRAELSLGRIAIREWIELQRELEIDVSRAR